MSEWLNLSLNFYQIDASQILSISMDASILIESDDGVRHSELLDSLLGSASSMGPNRVCVFLPSPEDGNSSSFRNTVFPDAG
jgi:hypothetical protein